MTRRRLELVLLAIALGVLLAGVITGLNLDGKVVRTCFEGCDV